MNDYTQYISPFSWRYSSNEMRQIWSEVNKRKLWRKVWLALAETQSDYGLISPEKLTDLRAHVEDIDIQLSLEIESQTQHDLMAELKAYASQCPLGGGSLHLGATSMDIEDNAEALRMHQALSLIQTRLASLLKHLTTRITELIDVPCMAFTHIQPAEPTTYGARLAFYAQDLLEDFTDLRRIQKNLRGKGFKGAVGSSAAYGELIGSENLPGFEKQLAEKIGLNFYPITSQIYPRRQEYWILSCLASIALTINKFAFDLRLLQSPLIGEASEPFGKNQVGSSAMPFKRNPIQAEKINSLARSLAHAPLIAWHNAANSLLERTLDDSANRRSLLPEAFLTLDELIITATRLIEGFKLHTYAIQRNLENYGPFSSTERLLMALSSAGADRQEMHEIIREHSLLAWQSVQDGQSNPLIEILVNESRFKPYFTKDHIRSLLNIQNYTGDASQRALCLVEKINEILKSAE
jgi:adenylosuccinate lyase